MRTPPLKMFAAGAVCAFMIIGCGPDKPDAESAPTDPPAPPAELTNAITIEEVPSADQIVFHSSTGLSPRELYRMNANGSGLTRLTEDRDAESDPVWSKDGLRVIYQCAGSICSSDPSGEDEKVLFTRDPDQLEMFSSPVLSPNGKVLAFEGVPKKKGTWDIYLYNLETKQLTNLTQTPNLKDFGPTWHPLGGLAWDTEGEVLYNSGDSDEVFELTDGSTQYEHAIDFSSDGSMMVFQGTEQGDGPRDIFLTDFDTDTTTKLTQTATIGDYNPAFSPDDTQIVYQRKDQASDQDDEIYVMNIDGSGVRRLTFNDAKDESPDWGVPAVTISVGEDVTAPEGNPPATTTPFEFEVELSQAATGNVSVKYTVTGISASVPGDVAAGSGTVTFTQGQKTKTVQVPVVADAVMETAESFKVTLSEPTGGILGDIEARGVIENDDLPPSPSPSPSVSPTTSPGLSDEGQIAWTSDENGDYDIWVKGLDGSNIRHVTSSSDTEASPDFSPDGETIVFHGGAGAPDIFWVGSDGTPAPTKIQGTASSADVTPTWSPDGSKVAWVSSGGSINIVQATPPNGPPSMLHDTATAFESYPDWHLLFNGNEGLVWQEQDETTNAVTMKLFDRDSGALRNLGEGYHPEISPDGKKLAYASDADGDLDIYLIDLTVPGSTPVQLTNAPGEDIGPSWSPDGSSIAFTSHRDGNAEIYIMAADGKQQTNFTNRPSDDFEPSWGVDPTSVRTVAPEPAASPEPKSRRRPDARFTIGLALPAVIAGGWMMRKRRSMI